MTLPPPLIGVGLDGNCERNFALLNWERQNMKGDIGRFEGFNFREQSAIDDILTAQQVLDWDHDADGEAEFWPHGCNPFTSYLLSGNTCTDSEVREVIRIFAETEGRPEELAKAIYLRDCGRSLEDITSEAINEASLYVFGPGWFHQLIRDAAFELFELFWPAAYECWEKNTVPGLTFDPEDFIESFRTLQLKLPEGYLVVDTE